VSLSVKEVTREWLVGIASSAFYRGHVGRRLQRALRRRSAELIVWRIGDPGAPRESTPDPEILIWCEANNFLLVTNNRSTMPVHLRDHLEAGHHVPGIFILSESKIVGATAAELHLIWAAPAAEEHQDQIRHLPISR
jgi:hypothetical protein